MLGGDCCWACPPLSGGDSFISAAHGPLGKMYGKSLGGRRAHSIAPLSYALRCRMLPVIPLPFRLLRYTSSTTHTYHIGTTTVLTNRSISHLLSILRQSMYGRHVLRHRNHVDRDIPWLLGLIQGKSPVNDACVGMHQSRECPTHIVIRSRASRFSQAGSIIIICRCAKCACLSRTPHFIDHRPFKQLAKQGREQQRRMKVLI